MLADPGWVGFRYCRMIMTNYADCARKRNLPLLFRLFSVYKEISSPQGRHWRVRLVLPLGRRCDTHQHLHEPARRGDWPNSCRCISVFH